METETFGYELTTPEIELPKGRPLLTIIQPEKEFMARAVRGGIGSLNNLENLSENIFIDPIDDQYLDYISTPHRNNYETKNIIYFPKLRNNFSIYEGYQPERQLNTLKNSKPELIGKILTNLVIQNTITSPSKLPIAPNIPASWLNGGNFPGLFNDSDTGALKPEDLPGLALPILAFMEDVKPHVVIGCDRGGRLFGLAMHAAWRQTRLGQPFPTLDGKLHFARVSKSEDSDIMQEKIDQIIESSKRLGAQRGNELADGEQLRVLFVDDWVIGGGTMLIAKNLTKSHGAKPYFAVMCGGGADVAGQPFQQTFVSWHDRPEEIGINYIAAVQAHPDGTFTQKQDVVAVRAPQATSNRKRIQDAAKYVAKKRTLQEVA